MSSTHSPPESPVPAPPPVERRCPRCGSTLSPDQEWCLNCGAAAETEIVEARGWRVPIYLSGGLTLLALIGIVLVIIALSGGGEKVAPSPTPTVVAQVPTPTPTPVPSPTTDPNASPTASPGASATPGASPTATPTAGASPTQDPNTGSGTGSSSTFPGWSGTDGWTIIIESATTQAKAESVATSAQSAGETVGILKSDDYSSLNAGYFVVFSGQYPTKQEAEAALSGVRAKHEDAYVRQVKK